MSPALDADGPVDPDAIARQLSARAESIERTQIEIAMAKLDEQHRDAVVELADRVVEDLLDGPLDALDSAAEREDTETLRAIAKLFDVEGDGFEETDEPASVPSAQ